MNYTLTMQTKSNERSLPKGWQWVKVGDLFEIFKGRKLENVTTVPTTNSKRYIQIEDLRSYDNLKYSIDSNGVFIGNNDVAIVWDGANAGEVGFGVEGYVGSTLAVLRTKGNATNSEFVARFLQTKFEYIHKNCSGATIPHVQKSILQNISIPLPSPDEQRRITSQLNEQLAAVESARKAAEEQLQAAWQLSSAYLREIFDNHTANQWSKVRLGNILNLRKEIIYPYDNPKGPAIFVGLEHIESNTGVRIGSVNVEMSELSGRKPKFHKGDIVYGYLRPYLNKVWIAEFDGLCSVDQYTFRVDDKKADSNFVAWFMRSPVYLERAPINTTPGQLPRIRTEEVASVEINLPPLKEQKRISLQISEKLGAAKNIVDTLESQLDEINRLPASLLREAFAGQG
jgi:type I restriction enzyme S subunit